MKPNSVITVLLPALLFYIVLYSFNKQIIPKLSFSKPRALDIYFFSPMGNKSNIEPDYLNPFLRARDSLLRQKNKIEFYLSSNHYLNNIALHKICTFLNSKINFSGVIIHFNSLSNYEEFIKCINIGLVSGHTYYCFYQDDFYLFDKDFTNNILPPYCRN